MRAISLLLVAGGLAVLPACLMLRHPMTDEDGPRDTDVPVVTDTDEATTDGSGTDDSDAVSTDGGAGDTDTVDSDTTATGDTDPATETADTHRGGPGNHRPRVTGVAIAPSVSVFNDHLLVCTSNPATDLDGNLSGTTLNWRNVTRGVDLGQSATLQLVSLLALPGDTVRCTVSAHDTLGAVGSSSSAVVVDDRVPVVSTPVVTPSPAYNTSTLACSATASDPDGTSTSSVAYAWTNVTRGTSLGSGASVTLSDTTSAPGETVRCSAESTGGGLTGTSGTSVTLGNRAPTVDAPVITPESPFNSSTLTCSVAANDPDGTIPGVTYEWTNVTTSTSLGSGETIDLTASEAAPGDLIECTATATDGSVPVESGATVVLANRAPAVSAPAVTPSPAYNTSSLTCTATALDPDGDSADVSFAWTNTTRGTVLGAAATLTLSSSVARPGEEIVCTATGSDGSTSTSAAASTVLTNRAPLVTLVSMPASPKVTDAITSTVVSSDPDGDTLTKSYTWSVTSSVTGTSTITGVATLPAGTAVRGDVIGLTVDVTDGAATTSRASSVNATVANSAPSAPGIALTSPPQAGVDLVCSVTTGSTDADGDAITYSFAWQWNGTAYTSATTSTTQSFIAGAAVMASDLWRCTVTAEDGHGGATASKKLSGPLPCANNSRVLSCGSPAVSATLDPATFYPAYAYKASGCGGVTYNEGHETWLFTCASSTTATVQLLAQDCDLDLLVFDGVCDPGTGGDCLGRARGTQQLTFACSPGKIYQIVVERTQTETSLFATSCRSFDDVGYQIYAKCRENCTNGVDDDYDGRIDCLDADCPPCTENCTNGRDDDFDSLIDCNDPDCPHC